jgi:hypothetical protein
MMVSFRNRDGENCLAIVRVLPGQVPIPIDDFRECAKTGAIWGIAQLTRTALHAHVNSGAHAVPIGTTCGVRLGGSQGDLGDQRAGPSKQKKRDRSASCSQRSRQAFGRRTVVESLV